MMYYCNINSYYYSILKIILFNIEKIDIEEKFLDTEMI